MSALVPERRLPNFESDMGMNGFRVEKFSKSPFLVWHGTNKREKSAQSLLRDETSGVDLVHFLGRLSNNGKLFLVMGSATDLVALMRRSSVNFLCRSCHLFHVTNGLRYFGVYCVSSIKNQEV